MTQGSRAISSRESTLPTRNSRHWGSWESQGSYSKSVTLAFSISRVSTMYNGGWACSGDWLPGRRGDGKLEFDLKKQIYLYGVCPVSFAFSVFTLPWPALPCEVEKHGVPEKEMLNLADQVGRQAGIFTRERCWYGTSAGQLSRTKVGSLHS
jgi:hypothetical protein